MTDRAVAADAARDGHWLALSVQASRTSAAIGRRDELLHQVWDQEVADRIEPTAPGAPASRAALAVIAECLARCRLSLRDLAGLCVADGPGAFTALRVAIGVMQGIGIATRLPVVAVPTLAALAVAATTADAGNSAEDSACAPVLPGSRLVLTAIDARMRECYFAVCEVDIQPPVPGRLAASHRPRLVVAIRPPAGGHVGDGAAALDVFLPEIAARGASARALILAGSGFASDPALLAWHAPPIGGRPAHRLPALEIDATAVLATALSGTPAGDWPGVAAADLRPRYLRDKVALDVDEQRALHARRDASSSRT